MSLTELWLPISGFPGYEVSNLGQVRSWWKGAGYRTKDINVKLKAPQIRQLRIYASGYVYVSMYKRDGVRKHRPIHRLVALAFIPNKKSKPQINHKNGVKIDNAVKNLEWVTVSENLKHAFRTGLTTPKKGEKHPLTKVTNKEADSILKDKRSYSKLAKKYNVSVSCIYRIKNKMWGHLWK